jgi:chaperonin GroEL
LARLPDHLGRLEEEGWGDREAQRLGGYEDLMAAGVVDPTKVARSALQNAASIAALMLMTEALITELPETNEKVPVTHPSGGYDEAY